MEKVVFSLAVYMLMTYDYSRKYHGRSLVSGPACKELRHSHSIPTNTQLNKTKINNFLDLSLEQ